MLVRTIPVAVLVVCVCGGLLGQTKAGPYLGLTLPGHQAVPFASGVLNSGLATRDKLNMVFVERREGQNQLLLNLRVGSTVPIATSAFGWAYLAGVPATTRTQIIREIQRHDPGVWASAKPAFNRALAEYRETGLILNAAVFHKAYNTLAVPIVLADGSVPYCLNCGSAVSTLSEKVLRKEVAPRLLELAGLLQDFLNARP